MPFDIENYRTSSCSTSERTGFVPYHVKLTCTTHGGMNGCVATGRVDLSEQLPHPLYGTAYRYMCDRELHEGTVAIQDADLDLSGVRLDAIPAGSQQAFKQVRVRAEMLRFDPVTFVLEWQLTVNWMSAPSSMVDLFTIDVFGEIVWTTAQDSLLVRTSGSCSAPGEQCTASAATITWPAGWIYGGTAMSGIDIESQSSAWLGVSPAEVSVEISESVGSSKAKIAPACTLRDGNTPAPGIACGYHQLTIVGRPTEVFRAWVGPFVHSSNPPTAAGFSTPFFKKAATRCGLRGFSATSGVTAGGTTSVMWFGADSRDCGWSIGDLYNGMGLHGFQADGVVGAAEEVSFSLDATRLP